MPARSLQQVLEGVQFPCGRSQLVEYARRNQVTARSLEALEAIPDRKYRDLSELFSALPSSRRATIAPAPQEEEEEEEVIPNPVDAAMQVWLCGLQAWPEWVRLSQRLWFPWLR
ncbi:MAG: DUF2795 domain-containing protein [Rhodospirillaceae bacterium]|nr:DUF2795 domain-containing protein [Rhodospirillales bacterium]